MTQPHADHPLHSLIRPEAVVLDLPTTGRDDVLDTLVGRLGYDPDVQAAVRQILELREAKGSTGIGHGVAVPHARCNEVSDLRVAYGRPPPGTGIDWDALDGADVRHVFLIVAPPVHVSNAYLQVMGDVARLARDPTARSRLAALDEPEDLIELVTELGF